MKVLLVHPHSMAPAASDPPQVTARRLNSLRSKATWCSSLYWSNEYDSHSMHILEPLPYRNGSRYRRCRGWRLLPILEAEARGITHSANRQAAKLTDVSPLIRLLNPPQEF